GVTLEPPRDSTIGEAFRHQVEHLTFCYWLLAHARGKGLATSALRLVARWAFDALGVKRIGLNTDPRNVASALRCRTRRLHTRRSAALLGIGQRRACRPSVVFTASVGPHGGFRKRIAGGVKRGFEPRRSRSPAESPDGPHRRRFIAD